MRITDLILRRGHVSERALVDAVTAGVLLPHVTRCGRCTERAVELTLWFDEMRTYGHLTADGAFPPERLDAQQLQILRRLEQADEPTRVLAFPTTGAKKVASGTRRFSPVWIGVAAAAGLVLGLSSGLLRRPATAVVPPVTSVASVSVAPEEGPAAPVADAAAAGVQMTPVLMTDRAFLEEIDRPELVRHSALQSLTPRQYVASVASLSRPRLANR